ncbi:hypothetical protein SETIT_6G230100v2 [Setaria italica]|uniref:PAS domain-containing protein n=1 Tax=Setaria italica TaxID=4555 RepID=K3YLS4_SETIT|nr:hypothetical protein SETIT_6G230100v2 [Setaria italica]
MEALELLKRIRELEEGQAELKREVSELLTTTKTERRGGGAQWQPSPSSSSRRRLPPPLLGRAGLSRRHHAMVMQSLGQAVHILDLQGKVLYSNRHAEHLYGYSASEAIGREVTELLVHSDDIGPAINIIGSIFTGKCWRGKFPVKNKSVERFSIITNGTPLCLSVNFCNTLYDDDFTMIGLICLSEDTRTLQEIISHATTLGYYYYPIT